MLNVIVVIRDRDDCVEKLERAIDKITAKDNISTGYLLGSPSDSNHPNHPVQKVCTTLYPRPDLTNGQK